MLGVLRNPRSSADIMVLVCRIISQDQVSTGLSNFFEKDQFKVNEHFATVSGHRYCDIRDVMGLFFT